MSGIALGTLAVAGAIVAPAIQAQENGALRSPKRQVPDMAAGIGVFTPASADPKLAAVLARTGLSGSGFRFTPSESRRTNRAVSLAVSGRINQGAPGTQAAVVTPPTITLAPIAYNLGVSVDWKRFAVSGDMARVDLVSQPGSRERAELGVSYTGKRAAGRISATGDRPLANTPVLIGDNPNYSFDLGGAYSVTRNLDVTAGVRYKSEEQRLPRLTEERRDSQAVYVGTAFRF